MTQGRGQRSGMPLRRIDITLDLAQGDRSFGQAAIFMKDRVVQILPTLVDQTVSVLAVILDKTVAIRIAVGIDPMQRRLDMGP